ncbi:MAG: ABC transporter permease [Pseudomonadota bacterium]
MATVTRNISLRNQARVIWACTTRFVQARTRESPIGILSNIVEPLATILILGLIFTYIRFRLPKLGDYLMLFLMTAILPITMFRQGATQSEQVFMRLKRNLVLPQVQPIDLLLAGLLTTFLTTTALFMLLTIVFVLIYDVPWPQNIVFCMIPTFCNAMIGLGFGMMNLVIKSWFFYWGVIFGTLTAPVGVLSGMFFTADYLPQAAQDILYWSPLMHSTELMRTYYYKEFTSEFFDPIYYYGFTFTALAVGLICERTFRYRIIKDKK